MDHQQDQTYSKGLDFSLWKKVLSHARPYYPQLVLIMVFMGLSTLLDVTFPLLTRYAIDHFIGFKTTQGLGLFIAIYTFCILLQGVAIYLFLHYCGRVEVGVCYLIRKEGFQKLQELPFSYYDTMPVGFLMTRMTSDSQRLADTIGWSLLDLVWGCLFLVFCSVQMLVLNWKLALIVLAVLPVLGVISWQFQKRILQSYRQVRKTNSEITSAFNEGIMGAKTSKTLVREALNQEEFTTLSSKMKKSSIRAASLSALLLPMVISISSVATAVVLSRAGHDVLFGVLTLGTLQLFVTYSVQFFEPVRGLARVFAELQSSQAAAERVMSLLDTKPDIIDTQEVIDVFGDNFHPKKENWPPFNGDITFDKVSFEYKGGEKVLEDFSLSIKAGQTIALVGETGSGKSTIINLVCRFYEPTRGTIYIDGVDYKQRSQLWLQSHLGYVLQQPQLFSGTVAENIAYGKPDATQEEIEAAAKMVYAHDFIMTLEKGYQSSVGEGGGRLSTGQKQLISFARAIICNPSLFVLDEATSSVDTQTELMIQRAIQNVLVGRTSFIIAHRLSTIRSADRILVIRDGKILEDGTHHQLLHQKGYYHRLYTSQFEDEMGKSILQKIV